MSTTSDGAQILANLQSEVRDFIGRQKGVSDVLSQAIVEHDEKLNKMSAEMTGKNIYTGPGSNPAAAICKGFNALRGDFDRHQKVRFEVPSPTLHAKALASTGITNPQGAGVIGDAGGFNYGAVRNLFKVLPISGGGVFQLREDSANWDASPQTEGLVKNESTTTLAGETIPIQTIAHWIAVTRQALDDVDGLQAYLGSRLLWGLARRVDIQILLGSGVSPNLTGLVPEGTAFTPATFLTDSDGWEFGHLLLAAATQCKIAGFNPNFCVVNPIDAFKIRSLRDSTGQYVAAPPSAPPIVESVAMTQGQFLVGDSTQAILRVKMNAVIDVSESHSDFFVRNQLALRAEERLALQILSPSAFIKGSFSQSPA